MSGQWATVEELGKGIEDLRRFLAEAEGSGFAVSYLAHRIARAHLVRQGTNLYDVRDSLGDAGAIFRASWPWSFEGAEEVGEAVLESPAWRETEPYFSSTAGLPF